METDVIENKKKGPNPWKVAIILEELGVPYHQEFLDFSVLKQEPFISANPNGRLPALEDPNTSITLFEVSHVRKESDHFLLCFYLPFLRMKRKKSPQSMSVLSSYNNSLSHTSQPNLTMNPLVRSHHRLPPRHLRPQPHPPPHLTPLDKISPNLLARLPNVRPRPLFRAKSLVHAFPLRPPHDISH